MNRTMTMMIMITLMCVPITDQLPTGAISETCNINFIAIAIASVLLMY